MFVAALVVGIIIIAYKLRIVDKVKKKCKICRLIPFLTFLPCMCIWKPRHIPLVDVCVDASWWHGLYYSKLNSYI